MNIRCRPFDVDSAYRNSIFPESFHFPMIDKGCPIRRDSVVTYPHNSDEIGKHQRFMPFAEMSKTGLFTDTSTTICIECPAGLLRVQVCASDSCSNRLCASTHHIVRNHTSIVKTDIIKNINITLIIAVSEVIICSNFKS